MEPRAKYTLVGSVVLIFTALIIGVILWLSEASSLRNSSYYTIYFKEHTPNGLQKDSQVTMRGIKVGSVYSSLISSKNIERVKVTILVNQGTPIKEDTQAIINRNLLTGFASIDLVKGTQDAPMLNVPQQDEEYPVIPEGRSELDEIANSVPELAERVGTVVNRLQLLLSDENLKSFSNTIRSVDQITAGFAENRGHMDELFTKLDAISEQFVGIGKSVNRFADNTDRNVSQVSSELVSTLRQARTSLASFNDHSTEAITAISTASQIFTQEASHAAESISSAADAASTTLEGFRQPRNLLTGPNEGSFGPGEGRHK